MMSRPRFTSVLALALCSVTVLDCASAPRRFALRPIVWTDNDTRPLHHAPRAYWSSLYWDGADHMVFRPVSHAFLLETSHEAVNVNALDEVPDSSWYQNRLATRRLSAQEIFEGPCANMPMPDANGVWTITGSKPNGFFPGFMVRGPDGQRYMMKADGETQSEQTSAGDIVGSRLFWAAGYNAPCNRAIRLAPSALHIAPGTRWEDDAGYTHPMTTAQVDQVFARARRYEDGTYRFGISRFVEGRPLGPFTYEGTRHDDPNDIIPHEDRRDLRGAKLISAWINHWDAREQNTLTTWIDTGDGTGYVRHYMLDFGDTLGSVWPIDGLSRRLGFSGYFYADHIVEDFVTFGAIDRPWDHTHVSADGWIFGYFNSTPFDPASWRPGYSNTAYDRMTERDGAWMARIIARFSDEDIDAVVRSADLSFAPWSSTLSRILRDRRDRILARYLTRLSSLTDVVIDGPRVCAMDRAREAGVYARVTYHAEWLGDGSVDSGVPLPASNVGARLCVSLPEPPSSGDPSYGVLRLDVSPDGRRPEHPLRVHLYALGRERGYAVAGIER